MIIDGAMIQVFYAIKILLFFVFIAQIVIQLYNYRASVLQYYVNKIVAYIQ